MIYLRYLATFVLGVIISIGIFFISKSVEQKVKTVPYEENKKTNQIFTLVIDNNRFIEDMNQLIAIGNNNYKTYSRRYLMDIPTNAWVVSLKEPNPLETDGTATYKTIVYFSITGNEDSPGLYSHSFGTFSAKKIFSSKGVHPIVKSVSSNNEYLAFYKADCIECELAFYELMIINLKTKKIISLGKVRTFEWLEGRKYRYKELIPKECGEIRYYSCFEDPENLNYIYAAVPEEI